MDHYRNKLSPGTQELGLDSSIRECTSVDLGTQHLNNILMILGLIPNRYSSSPRHMSWRANAFLIIISMIVRIIIRIQQQRSFT